MKNRNKNDMITEEEKEWIKMGAKFAINLAKQMSNNKLTYNDPQMVADVVDTFFSSGAFEVEFDRKLTKEEALEAEQIIVATLSD